MRPKINLVNFISAPKYLIPCWSSIHSDKMRSKADPVLFSILIAFWPKYLIPCRSHLILMRSKPTAAAFRSSPASISKIKARLQSSRDEFCFDLKKFRIGMKSYEVPKTLGEKNWIKRLRLIHEVLLVLWQIVKTFRQDPEALFSQLLNIIFPFHCH